MKERILFIDYIKSFAIFLVVLGHAIQFTAGKYAFTNSAFNFIYTFHLPLFMMISGFFFMSSMEEPFAKFIKKKSVQLLLPAIIWGLCKIVLSGGSEVVGKLFSFWFLYSVWLSYIISYVSLKISRKFLVAFLVIVIISIFIPMEDIPGHLNYMLPCFWCGIFVNKYKEKLLKHRKSILLCTMLAFLGLITLWNWDYYTYHSPLNFINGNLLFSTDDMLIYLYRLCIGISASIAIFMLFSYLKSDKLILKSIGKNTLGIYVITVLMCDVQRHFLNTSFSNGLLVLIIALLIATVELIISMLTIKFLNANKILGLLFLGKAITNN